MIKGSRTLSRRKIAYAIEQQRSGVSQQRLAAELGCSQNAVSRAVQGQVLMHPRRKRYAPEVAVRARQLFAQNMSKCAIARELGVVPTTVRRWLSTTGATS